jgi:HAMP domain-containing protein
VQAFALLLVGLLVAAVLASILIDTDRERVTRTIHRTAQALEAGDVSRVMEQVAPDFEQEGMGRAELEELVRVGLEKYGAPRLSIDVAELELAGGRATCRVQAVVSFPEVTASRGRFGVTHWQVGLREVEGRWLLARVVPLRFGDYEPRGLTELRNRWGRRSP